MTWRPEDWTNPYKEQQLFLAREDSFSLRSGLMESGEVVFEAGADAMLKALLRGTCLFVPAGHFLFSVPVVQPKYGCWVFIPSEKEC